MLKNEGRRLYNPLEPKHAGKAGSTAKAGGFTKYPS